MFPSEHATWLFVLHTICTYLVVESTSQTSTIPLHIIIIIIVAVTTVYRGFPPMMASRHNVSLDTWLNILHTIFTCVVIESTNIRA